MPSHSGDSMLSNLSQFGDVYAYPTQNFSILEITMAAKLPTKCYFRKLWLSYNALNIRKY
jgi:hypothetical protein